MSTHDWRQYAPHYDDPCNECGKGIASHYIRRTQLRCPGPDLEMSKTVSPGPWTVVDLALLRSQVGWPISDTLRDTVTEQINRMKEEANA